MALAGEGSGVLSQLNKSDLADIKDNLRQHLTNIIDKKLDPVMAQISALSATLKDVADTADATYLESEKNRGADKGAQSVRKTTGGPHCLA